MILKTIEFSEYPEKPKKWHLNEFSFENINLLVGKNSTGKTRTLNVISNLARIVSGEAKMNYFSLNYILTFDKNGIEIKYYLNVNNWKVVKEILIVDGKKYLNRGIEGKGKIYAVKLEENIEFQTPDSELACVARRDSVQHPFFDDLYQWGKSLIYYEFGSDLGRNRIISISNKEKDDKLNPKETKKVIEIFKKGKEKYSNIFVNTIKEEMGRLGYKIDKVGIDLIPDLVIDGLINNQIVGLYVKETDLEEKTFQINISQGMFRALSLIIQMTFSQLENTTDCVLIDDIGEGLDFERSVSLIKLLVEKAEKSSMQLIMSTNDRFVMNNIPLKYWLLIQRIGGECTVFNYHNSKKVFDEFEFTGLSNFDFFSTNFLNEN